MMTLSKLGTPTTHPVLVGTAPCRSNASSHLPWTRGSQPQHQNGLLVCTRFSPTCPSALLTSACLLPHMLELLPPENLSQTARLHDRASVQRFKQDHGSCQRAPRATTGEVLLVIVTGRRLAIVAAVGARGNPPTVKGTTVLLWAVSTVPESTMRGAVIPQRKRATRTIRALTQIVQALCMVARRRQGRTLLRGTLHGLQHDAYHDYCGSLLVAHSPASRYVRAVGHARLAVAA